MIRFESGDATFASVGDAIVVIGRSGDDEALDDILGAAANRDAAFRSLAQVVVGRDFSTPPFLCARAIDDRVHLFLFGGIAAHVDGSVIRGDATSTWTEQTISAADTVAVRLDETGSPSDATPNESRQGEAPRAETPTSSPNPPQPNLTRSDVNPAESDDDAEAVDRRGSAAEVSSAPPRELQAAADPTPATRPGSAVSDTDVTLDATELLDAGRPVARDPDATMDESEILAPQPEAPPGIPQETGGPSTPTVVSRICPCGTPNPLEESVCRSCARSLYDPDVRIGDAARPSLGRLVLDDGSTVELDRSLVVGRNPPDDLESGGRLLETVRVDSPGKHVSKGHLEVRLIDWTVNIVDLDSANGTYVDDGSGRPPKKLRPNVIEQLLPGSTVLFGDRSFRFDLSRPG